MRFRHIVLLSLMGIVSGMFMARARAQDTPPVSEVSLYGVAAAGSDLTWECGPDGLAGAFEVERIAPSGHERVWVIPGDIFDPGATVRLNAEAPANLAAVYRITSVDSHGTRRLHGPFTVMHGAAPAPAVSTRVQASAPIVVESTSTPGQRIKITVRDDGLYYLDSVTIADNLLALGQEDIETLIATTNLALTSQGADVSWFGATNSAGIYFYAEGTNSRYTADNVYWLAPGTGQAMAVGTGGAPPPGDTTLTYMAVYRGEENSRAYTTLFDDPEADFWFWHVLSPYFPVYESYTMPFSVNSIPAPGGTGAVPVTVTASLKGASLTDNSPDHGNYITLNGVTVASNTWDEFEALSVSNLVTALVEGTNALVTTSFLPAGFVGPGYTSVHVFDWFEIRYPRYYVAITNELWCNGSGTNVITVRGYSTSDLAVYDVSNPLNPLRLDDTTIDAGTNSDYRVSFRSASSSNRYYVVSTGNLRVPESVRGRMIVDLSGSTNRGDHLTIVAPGFESTVATLAEHRRSQGLDAKVVGIEDVYDTYSYGLVTPWAIRDFLLDALQLWDDPPSYVVLAGSGSYDYRNYTGAGDCTVPSAIVAVPSQGLRTSDAPLADLLGQGAPEIAIGRFHCQTTQEMAGVISKIISFETGGAWRDTVLLTADAYDPEAGDFSASCAAAAAYVTSRYTTESNYVDVLTYPVVKNNLISGINGGRFLVSYFGHGAPEALANGSKILALANLGSFTNATQAPLMIAMTCDFAYFGQPDKEKLGEGLVARPEGGLSGLWGCVADTYNYASEELCEYLFDHIFTGRRIRLGDAIVAALDDYEDSGTLPYVLDCMAFLGDPATVVAPEVYSYELWRSGTFPPGDATNDVVSAPQADPDGDRTVNIVEFTQNTDPTSTTNAPHFSAYVEYEEAPPGSGNTNEFATIEYRRRKWMEGYRMRVETTRDLIAGPWNHGALVSADLVVTDVDDTVEDVKVRVYPPLSPTVPLFVRLAIVEDD